MSLLSVRDLRVHFHTREGLVKAVDGIEFDLEKGKTLGIVGESGSGKSVSCLSLMGLLPSPPARVESGTAQFEGIELLHAPEHALRTVRGNRIGMIFQDPLTSLNPYMTIGRQMLEPIHLHLKLGGRSAVDRAVQALDEVGITSARERLDSYPHEFSGGMRQRVMIAMALVTEPVLLIADEPTTALDVTIQAQILDLIRKLQEKYEIGTIFISHNLGVIAGIADHVLVMNQGVCVEQGTVKAIFQNPRDPYTRKLLDSIPASAKPTPPPATAAGDAPLLRLEGIRVNFGAHGGMFERRGTDTLAVDGVTLDIHRGEILGLVGESGSGKSTVARTIVRLVEPTSGQVILGADELTSLPPAQLNAVRPKMQMIFQDPFSSLDPRMTVYDCLAEALRLRRRYTRNELLKRIAELMRDVDLDPKVIRKYPHEFSGGQRQRIAIARALAMEPELVIADEPVSSLDVTVQAQILKLLLDLNRDRGLTMLFISHDLSVIRYVADRTAVMYRGKIVEIGGTEKLFSNPRHDYTKSLLSAIPIPDPDRERNRKRIVYTGET